LSNDPILLTGAGGLIGRTILSGPDRSRRIYAVFRESGQPPLPDHVTALVHDLRRHEYPPLPELPETLIHLAQSPLYREFPDGADDVFEVNVGSTQRLLDWACRKGVKRFIYASSGGIYGRGKDAFEEDAPLREAASLGHYLASKRCGELLAQAYSDRMIVIVLRLFFVYGPGQRRTMLIPRLIDDITNERSISLRGPDGIRINPIYCIDAAAAIRSAVSLQESMTINVAGPQVLTLRDIATIAGKCLGRLPRLAIQCGDDAGDLIASVSKMTALLGAPEVTMTDGLRRTIAAHGSQCWSVSGSE
jgi:nucleoside-diphosphate-sugar epimerase